MAKKLKQIGMEESLISQIEAIANEEFDGNFTAALLDCAMCGIAMRDIPERYREMMKAGANRTYPAFNEYYIDNTRTVVDALQI